MELCRTNHAFKKCHRNEVLAAALLHDYCKVGKYRDKGKITTEQLQDLT